MPVVTQYFTPNPGLGDHIRGAVWLRRVAAEYGYEYRPNFTLHPAAPFIDTADSDASDPPEPLDEYFIHTMGIRVASCLIRQMMESQQDISIACNIGAIATPITPLALAPDDKAFVRELIRPAPDIAAEVDQIAAGTNAQSKTLYHFRVLDSWSPYTPQEDLINFFEGQIKGRDAVVFSDNQPLKEALVARIPTLTILGDSEHFGFLESDGQAKDGMIDFFLLPRFREVVSYSQYSWASNFLSYKAAAHEVPLTAHCIEQSPTGEWAIENNGWRVRSTAMQHDA